MGCGKSRCFPWDSQSANMQGSIVEIYIEEETKVLLNSAQTTEKKVREAKEDEQVNREERLVDNSLTVALPVSRIMTLPEYAEKMSEDIVAQALQLCWEVDNRYKDLPFIDVECDYMI